MKTGELETRAAPAARRDLSLPPWPMTGAPLVQSSSHVSTMPNSTTGILLYQGVHTSIDFNIDRCGRHSRLSKLRHSQKKKHHHHPPVLHEIFSDDTLNRKTQTHRDSNAVNSDGLGEASCEALVWRFGSLVARLTLIKWWKSAGLFPRQPQFRITSGQDS